MLKTFLLIFIFSCFYLKDGISQTIELNGKKLTFGTEDKAPFWTEGAQIESDYSFIEFYECNSQADCINGAFYKNKLAAIYYTVNDGNAYPVSKDIEALIGSTSPFKEYTESEFMSIDYQLFKTSDFYISRGSSRMNTDYIIIPIKILIKTQKQHPEYLKKFTE